MSTSTPWPEWWGCEDNMWWYWRDNKRKPLCARDMPYGFHRLSTILEFGQPLEYLWRLRFQPCRSGLLLMVPSVEACVSCEPPPGTEYCLCCNAYTPIDEYDEGDLCSVCGLDYGTCPQCRGLNCDNRHVLVWL